jgi:cytochrome c
MKNIIILLFAAIFCLSVTTARADDREIAVGLVKKAAAYYKANGAEKLIEEANNPKGEFVKGAFYVFVMDKDAVMLAHPINPSLIGQPQMAVQDVDGKYMSKEMADVTKSKGSGWVDYRFKNPKTNEIAPKTSYVERADDLILGCGFYKK